MKKKGMDKKLKEKRRKRIGIVGGGQLGKMMILDAKRLDYFFVILDPVKNCPADSIADEHIVAGFDNREAIKELASKVDVVTYEFEHINAEALEDLENSGYPVYPTSRTLRLIQNKCVQKDFLRKQGLPVPNFVETTSISDIMEAGKIFSYPMVLKTCTGGYDGKGNGVISCKEECESIYKQLGGGTIPLMVEEFVPFEKEVSILACRSTNGEIVVYPIAENIHKNSILDETMVPAILTEQSEKEAREIATKAISAFDGYGMLCIELFVKKDGHVLVNELAPRPHNSGHYTIEGCYTSQYENHIRAVLGLPLGNTDLIRPTVMKNLIGERNGEVQLSGIEKAYEDPNIKIHIYGKEKVAIGRKMGHITATSETILQALESVRKAHSKIQF